MSDLQGRVGRLERGLGARAGRWRWRELLAPYFTAPIYDRRREALLDALCSANPAFHFAVEDGPERGRYYVWWWARSEPPVIMRIQLANADEMGVEGEQ